MKTILKSSTSLGLALMMSLPAPAFAQQACAPRINDHTYPCTLPSGLVVESRVEVLEDRVERETARVEELRLKVTQSDRDVSINVAAVLADLEEWERRLENTEAALQRARDAQAQADGNAEAQQQAADAEAAKQAQAQQQAADAKAAQQAQAQRDAEAAARLEAEAADAERQAAAAAQAEADKQAQKQLKQAEKEARKQAKEAQKAQRRAESQQTAAASATAQQQSAATTETEELNDDNVRSSNEEFETAVAGSGAESNSKDDDGLSKFEKALLLGLGAVAVGQVLKNGDEVVSRSGDRVVVERDGDLRVLKNDDALLRQAGNDLTTETFDDGSTRTTVLKPNGARIVTIRGADGTVLRRVRITPNGEEYTLFDDTRSEEEIIVSQLAPQTTASPQAPIRGEEELRAALRAEAAAANGQRFSLRQVREVEQVRELAQEIQLDAVRFATGSAAIQPEQARNLARIGNTLRELIAENPRTVLLVEGHTDAVGDATYNLALSDRRAETVALALTEYFEVPAENMIVQGYGESQLKVPTLEAEQANRRAVVRNITSLLR
ncbi:OmpA family protein [Sulfitobacter sp. HNIBRBA3233]|uniref:OmpA family protein n=1 Tax=Sulfitobacter marinivivus TaxID=3158558 RepID=UPI0032DF508A